MAWKKSSLTLRWSGTKFTFSIYTIHQAYPLSNFFIFLFLLEFMMLSPNPSLLSIGKPQGVKAN